jgi:hypothetical protein
MSRRRSITIVIAGGSIITASAGLASSAFYINDKVAKTARREPGFLLGAGA